MANSRSLNDKFNASSCADSTAYLALQNVEREERRKLISILKGVAVHHGYRIISTIELEAIGGDRNE